MFSLKSVNIVYVIHLFQSSVAVKSLQLFKVSLNNFSVHLLSYELFVYRIFKQLFDRIILIGHALIFCRMSTFISIFHSRNQYLFYLNNLCSTCSTCSWSNAVVRIFIVSKFHYHFITKY